MFNIFEAVVNKALKVYNSWFRFVMKWHVAVHSAINKSCHRVIAVSYVLCHTEIELSFAYFFMLMYLIFYLSASLVDCIVSDLIDRTEW